LPSDGTVDPYIAPEETEAWTNWGAKYGEVKEKYKHVYHNWWYGTRRMKKKEGFVFDKKVADAG